MKKTIFGLLCVFIINNDVTHAEAPKPLPIVNICPSEVVCKIKETFPEEPEVMLAIAMAESGLNNNAIGYNCYYEGKSTACKPQDRDKAWSVDCFVLQQNFPNRKTCPKMSIDEHLKEIRSMYDKRGLSPWCSYKDKLHLKYLPEARGMI